MLDLEEEDIDGQNVLLAQNTVSWTEKRTNQCILDQLRVKKRLSIVVEDKTAKFFGHVGFEKLTLEGTFPSKKSRERPPTTYVDLMIGLIGKNFTQTSKMTEEIQKWKAIAVQSYLVEFCRSFALWLMGML